MKRHGRTYGAQPHVKKQRAARNKARKEAMEKGLVKKGDGKDVHHVKPLSKGGSLKGKTKVVPASKNRGHGMTNGKKPNQGRQKKKR